MGQRDIIKGKVTRIINGETFELRVDALNYDNQGVYVSVERVLITDLHSPKLYQRHGFRIKKLLRKTIGGRVLRIEVLNRNNKGHLETTYSRLSKVISR